MCRKSWGADGSYGLDVGRVCGRVHCQGCRRFRHAAKVCPPIKSHKQLYFDPIFICVYLCIYSGTSVSVESVDEVFQAKMLDMLKQTGRYRIISLQFQFVMKFLYCLIFLKFSPEMVVGWYHSHPGFGCWLSSVDVHTQKSFESMAKRAVAVVVDPIQSVKGKVVIDAFRSIDTQTAMMGTEPRQTTSNVGHLQKPSIQVHFLNIKS